MIRIGIVGCGRILAAHLQGYRLLHEAGVDDFQITALCSRRRSDAAMYVSRRKGPPQRPPVSDIPGDPLAIGDEYLSDFQDGVEVALYTDFRRMIAEGPIDAVNDFTTHALHHQVAEAAFANGKHLLTQKPMAVSIRAARRMCDQAQARDRVFGVFENFRQSPTTRQLRWLFESGVGGVLQMILLGYVGLWWAPDRIVALTPWRHRLTEGGGICLDLGVHFFDQIRHVAGEVQEVSAQTAVVEPRRFSRAADGGLIEQIECDADDTCFAAFKTARNVVGNLSASWAGHAAPSLMGEGSVYYGSNCRVGVGEVKFDSGETEKLADLYERRADAETKAGDFPIGLQDSFALAQYDWLQAIHERRQPETGGSEGLRDLAAAMAMLESDRAGRRVEVAEVLDGSLRDYQRPIDERFGLV